METLNSASVQNIADFLQKINCDHLLPRFEEHKIDIQHISKLIAEKDMIRELIPNIGDRLNFISKYEEQILSIRDNNITVCQVGDDGLLIPLEKNFTSTDMTDTSDSDATIIITEDKSKQISHNSHELYNEKEMDMPDFNLIELLEQAPMGKAIISYYDNKNCLNDCFRNKLVDIIMRHLFAYHCKHRLTGNNYQSIVKKIKELFPNEPATVYYIGTIRKQESSTGRTIIAKGKLIDKAKNLIYQGGYARYTKKRKSTENTIEIPTKQKIDLFTNDSYLWLKTRNDPWEEVIIHWKNTYQLRKESEATTAYEFIEQWPILNQSNVDTLINYDFEQQFPNRTCNLYKYWNLFFDKVVNCKESRNKENVKIDIENLNSLSENSKVVKQIETLCHMLPSRGRLIVKKTHWKFSIQECIDSIIIHATSAADIETKFNLQKERAKIRGLHLQPFLLIEGPTYAEINKIYVVINEIKYEYDNCLKALDILFKLFHVMCLHYPPQSEHIYESIEVVIFNSQRKSLKRYAYVQDIMENIKFN